MGTCACVPRPAPHLPLHGWVALHGAVFVSGSESDLDAHRIDSRHPRRSICFRVGHDRAVHLDWAIGPREPVVVFPPAPLTSEVSWWPLRPPPANRGADGRCAGQGASEVLFLTEMMDSYGAAHFPALHYFMIPAFRFHAGGPTGRTLRITASAALLPDARAP